MDNGEVLFMSRETRNNISPDSFATGRPVGELAVLEYPINFEKFGAAKTINNVVDWTRESM